MLGQMFGIAKTMMATGSFALLGATAATADSVTLMCKVSSVILSSDQTPYYFSVLINRDKQMVVSVNGHSGVWTTDKFTNTVITAHFEGLTATGTLTIDRITGIIDTTTVLHQNPVAIWQWEGTCSPTP